MEVYNSWRTALRAGGVAAMMMQLIRGFREGVAHRFIPRKGRLSRSRSKLLMLSYDEYVWVPATEWLYTHFTGKHQELIDQCLAISSTEVDRCPLHSISTSEKYIRERRNVSRTHYDLLSWWREPSSPLTYSHRSYIKLHCQNSPIWRFSQVGWFSALGLLDSGPRCIYA